MVRIVLLSILFSYSSLANQEIQLILPNRILSTKSPKRPSIAPALRLTNEEKEDDCLNSNVYSTVPISFDEFESLKFVVEAQEGHQDSIDLVKRMGDIAQIGVLPPSSANVGLHLDMDTVHIPLDGVSLADEDELVSQESEDKKKKKAKKIEIPVKIERVNGKYHIILAQNDNNNRVALIGARVPDGLSGGIHIYGFNLDNQIRMTKKKDILFSNNRL